MEPITGLLAEFKRELTRVMQERYSGEVEFKSERDETVRREIESRPLLLDKIVESEIEAGEAI